MLNFTIDMNHPSLPGHFKGNPVVPGVVILQNVFAAFKKIYPEQSIHKILNMKFRNRLSINMESDVTFKETQAKQFKFQVKQDNKLITSGSLITESVT